MLLSYAKAFINGVFHKANIMHIQIISFNITHFTCYFLNVYNI